MEFIKLGPPRGRIERNNFHRCCLLKGGNIDANSFKKSECNVFAMKCNQKIHLVGEKVLLVPYRSYHVPKYHCWMQNADLRQLTASEPLSLEEEYEMQKKWAQDEDKCTFIILSKQRMDEGHSEVDSMVGDVNLFLFKDEETENSTGNEIGELEIMIAETGWRGRGLGREAATMMLVYAMDHLKIGKFQAKIGSANATSLNLFEKLGFRKIKYSEVFDEVTLVCDLQSSSENVKKIRGNCRFTVESFD